MFENVKQLQNLAVDARLLTDNIEFYLLAGAKAIGDIATHEFTLIETFRTGALEAVIYRAEPTAAKPQNDRGLGGGAALLGAEIRRFEDWITAGLARNLRRHLARGDLVLFVPVDNDAQEQAISKALLRYSADYVQIHDVPARLRHRRQIS